MFQTSFPTTMVMDRKIAKPDPWVVAGIASASAAYSAYYLSVPFPVEKAPTRKIMTGKGFNDKAVTVSQLLNYPVRGLVFCDAVSSSCIFLQNNNIPFNVLMADCGKRIFLFPQCYAEKRAVGEVSQELLDTQVNPAVWEN